MKDTLKYQETLWNSGKAKGHPSEDDYTLNFYKGKINELCQFEENDNALDAGCGNGEITNLIFHSNKISLSAIDYSKTFITKAKNKFPDIRWEVHNAFEKFPFSDNTFDIVYSISFLQYLPKPKLKPLLSEFKRITKPGGKIVQATVPVISRAYLHCLNYKNSIFYLPLRNLIHIRDILKNKNFIFSKDGGNYFQSTKYIKKIAKELNLESQFYFYSRKDNAPKECLYRADIVFHKGG